MAGRGRNQTIPSWMTVDGSAGVREEESSKSSLPGQFDDANGNDRDRRNRSSSRFVILACLPSCFFSDNNSVHSINILSYSLLAPKNQ